MTVALSRRRIADYAARQLLSGDGETIKRQVAAYLIESGRQNELDLMVRDIETALLNQGVVVVEIESARALPESTLDKTEQFIKKHYDNAQVFMRQTVNRNLLGGIKIRTPNAELDATLRRRLTNLIASKY